MELPPALVYIVEESTQGRAEIAAICDDGAITRIGSVPFHNVYGNGGIYPFVITRKGRHKLYALHLGYNYANIYRIRSDGADLIITYEQESLKHVEPSGQGSIIPGDIGCMIHLNQSRQLCFMRRCNEYYSVVLVGMNGCFRTKRVARTYWREWYDVAYYDPVTNTHYFVCPTTGSADNKCQIHNIMKGVKLITLNCGELSMQSVSILGNLLMFVSVGRVCLYDIANCILIRTWTVDRGHSALSLVTENTIMDVYGNHYANMQIIVRFTNQADGTSYDINNRCSTYDPHILIA